VVCLIFPACAVKNTLLRLLGWDIAKTSSVGHSIVYAHHIKVEERARIGHGNFIWVTSLLLKPLSTVQHLNRLSGPLYVALMDHSTVGNRNSILRGKYGVVWRRSIFKLGRFSKVTVHHTIDCTRPVKIGEYSILAG